MKTYRVDYSGNDRRAKLLAKEGYTIEALSESEAVKFFAVTEFPQKFFEQDDGGLIDSDGFEAMPAGETRCFLDGGWITAEAVDPDNPDTIENLLAIFGVILALPLLIFELFTRG